MSVWKEYKLGDISEDVSYGYTESANENPVGPKFLRITDIREGLINWDKVPYCVINQKDFIKYKIEIGDIVIARTGATTGITETIKHNVNAVFASYLIRFRINKLKANPFYIGYILKTNFWKDYVSSIVGGSAQPGANAKQFSDFSLRIPSLPTQSAIAEILSSLDDKIELNNKINQELEDLAQTLFKRWFIDFEFPNENGEPYKSSGGEMVESELGEIPKGWEVGNLNQIAELLKKNIKPFEHPNSTYHHYSLPEFDSGKIPSKDLGIKILSSKYQVVAHSILVSKLNPRIPRVWTIINPSQNSICSTEFQVMKPIEDKYFPFVNCLCLSNVYINSIQSKVTGTSSSHQRVNPNDIISYEMTLPPFLLVNQFYESIFESFIMIDENRTENIQLTNLRDTLLPKLISGELEVNNINF